MTDLVEVLWSVLGWGRLASDHFSHALCSNSALRSLSGSSATGSLKYPWITSWYQRPWFPLRQDFGFQASYFWTSVRFASKEALCAPFRPGAHHLAHVHAGDEDEVGDAAKDLRG